MSGFDPAWLALREPYDHAVRDPALTAAFVDAVGPSPRLVDLGCGSGSNLRFLASHLPPGQSWTCIDHDPALLTLLQTSKPAGIEAATICLDLAANLDDVPIGPGVAVTAAALLDLTSAAWLDRLAECCRNAPILMTLSFDGRMAWDPIDPDDRAIQEAFLRHQNLDKGFGPSLGPDAVRYLAARFQDLGHDVRLARSDWVFEADDRPIVDAMLAGVAGAVQEIDRDLPADAWQKRRRAPTALTVGHLDLLALPR